MKIISQSKNKLDYDLKILKVEVMLRDRTVYVVLFLKQNDNIVSYTI